MPTGIACIPDMFQCTMPDLLDGIDNILVYIDDVLILQKEKESEEDTSEISKRYYKNWRRKVPKLISITVSSCIRNLNTWNTNQLEMT